LTCLSPWTLLSMPALYTLLLLLLVSSFHAPPCSSTTSHDTLTAGQTLAVGDKLVSSNGKFALGFFQPAARTTISKSDTTTSPNWYLGIWFDKIPVFTTVWVGNREKPIPGPELHLTHLKISSDGNLAIVNHAGTESVLWSTHIINRTQTNINTSSTAVLLNSGNLVLTEGPSSGLPLWQSFDYPTDVLLPGAKGGRNKITGLSRLGISKKSLIDPGLGSYTLEVATSGIIMKRRNPSVVYWNWEYGTSQMSKLLPVIMMVLNSDSRTKGLINVTYVDSNEEEYYMYTSPEESSSTLSLDISGQIKLNIWSEAEQSWQTVQSKPIDPCTPTATCGPFTVCNGTARGNARPFCDCMESFSQKSPTDWYLDDRTGGCIRNTPLHCPSNKTSSTDMFHPIAHVTLPYNPKSIQNITTQRKCEEACRGSCSCTAYSYNNNMCSVWHGELLSVNLNDGIEIFAEDVIYLRLAANDFPSLSKNKRKLSVGVVIAASIISFALIMLVMLLVVQRNKFKWCCSPLYDNQGCGGIIAFRYTDLVHATKNFSEKLGGGGFGSVYKGVLSGSTPIAVKRLDGARQGEKQFRAEVSSLGLIQHINLVKLIGFCCEGHNRLLVYEHMLNGSLDGHLFKSNFGVLSWSTRYQIALGVARGLFYLHQSCHKCIIHCDIKPENILLDASFAPKVADFGLATFLGRNFSRILTTFRGTVGYLAPEWLSGVAVTPKIDVYSFGMVLLEIVSGRRNSGEEYTSKSYRVEYFPVQVVNKLHEGDVGSLVDPQLHGDFNTVQVERVCKVACWCIQDNEFDRPAMDEVVRVLEGLQEIDMPPMPRLLAAITEHSDTTSMGV
uniref:Receptor-like serine/threonine-protein kinase n=1 Tax=Aegilops tauschii subsp. strangulata TaxID=200361 RepID=A0A452XD28_AEGTS